MRKMIGIVGMVTIALGSMMGCAVESGVASDGASDEATSSEADALRVGVLDRGGDVASIDLSQPDVAKRFDTSRGTAELSRVRVTDGKGNAILLSDLVDNAEKRAGFKTPASGFVLRSSLPKTRWPGGGGCSIHTQTDCCECGFWGTSTGPFGGTTTTCYGYWCPIDPLPLVTQ